MSVGGLLRNQIEFCLYIFRRIIDTNAISCELLYQQKQVSKFISKPCEIISELIQLALKVCSPNCDWCVLLFLFNLAAIMRFSAFFIYWTTTTGVSENWPNKCILIKHLLVCWCVIHQFDKKDQTAFYKVWVVDESKLTCNDMYFMIYNLH